MGCVVGCMNTVKFEEDKDKETVVDSIMNAFLEVPGSQEVVTQIIADYVWQLEAPCYWLCMSWETRANQRWLVFDAPSVRAHFVRSVPHKTMIVCLDKITCEDGETWLKISDKEWVPKHARLLLNFSLELTSPLQANSAWWNCRCRFHDNWSTDRCTKCNFRGRWKTYARPRGWPNSF